MAMRQHDAIRPKNRVDGRCFGKTEWTDESNSSVHSFWRSIRESNPGTGLPAYRISSATSYDHLSNAPDIKFLECTVHSGKTLERISGENDRKSFALEAGKPA